MTTRAIFFSGLPKAGKSVCLHGLFQRLQKSGSRFFLERVNPDQEGNWTAETAGGQDMARGHKNLLKARGEFFSRTFVDRKVRDIQGLCRTFPVVLFDMGGIPSPENREFVAAARAAGAEVEALILHPHHLDPQEWVEFWAAEGVKPEWLATYFGGWEGGSSRWDSCPVCHEYYCEGHDIEGHTFEAEAERVGQAAMRLLDLY